MWATSCSYCTHCTMGHFAAAVPYLWQDGPDQDTAGSNVVRPVIGPDSLMQPRMSAFDLGSYGISRASRDTLNESDLLDPWNPACVTWREALAAAFPILAAFSHSAGMASGTAVRRELGMAHALLQSLAMPNPLFNVHLCCLCTFGCPSVQVQLICGCACLESGTMAYAWCLGMCTVTRAALNVRHVSWATCV